MNKSAKNQSEDATSVEFVALNIEGATSEDEDAPVAVRIVDLDRRWVNKIKGDVRETPRKIKVSSARKSCTIHRVPQCFLRHDELGYVPELISIGPLHYDKRKKELLAMEEHKFRYLKAILDRGEEECLEQMLIAMKKKEKRARKCYSEEINLKSDAFVEMMVIDGCFLIELFCRATYGGPWSEDFGYDPIFQLDWLYSKLKRDLLKLENQMPFFILQELFDIIKTPPGCSLVQMALQFLPSSMNKNKNIDGSNLEVKHLLHLLHSSLLPNPLEKIENPKPGNVKTIPSASQLDDAGMKFVMGSGDSFLEIRYRKGEIEIPPLIVEDRTYPLLLNLVAFEQCYRHTNSYFTTYTRFMACLVNSDKDVEILCRRGIIDNLLGSNEQVAPLFNEIQRDVMLSDDDFYLLNVFDSVNGYYKTLWPKWRANLLRNYFNSPWAIISVIAAIFLLLLTTTQTFFTISPRFAIGK